jgi:cytochrome c556
VKAEFFADREGVGKVAMAFGKEANEMAKVAAGGDAAAVKAQFGKLGESCKACHDKFRKEE